MLEWERDSEKKKKKKERKIIGQEDQILELTFDSLSGTFNLNFSKMNLPCSPKAKAKEKQRKRKRKKNKGEWGEGNKKKSINAFVCTPAFEKIISYDLLKTYL